jgi:arylsulfatase
MDLSAAPTAAAGVTDVADKMKTQHKQYVDGLNNLDYWTGKAA